MTFFSQLQHKYSCKQSVHATDECSTTYEGVDAPQFLAATRESLALLDKLGFAFRLVKNDILGNVSKLQSTYDSDPEKFRTFKAMLVHDHENGLSDDGYSATVALLWLKRALEFFCAFTALLVSEYRNGALGESLTHVVNTAYEQSLRRHHNWLMRGTFFVIDDMENFVSVLAPNLALINGMYSDMGRPD